jgi:hypothetical protein
VGLFSMQYSIKVVIPVKLVLDNDRGTGIQASFPIASAGQALFPQETLDSCLRRNDDKRRRIGKVNLELPLLGPPVRRGEKK